MIEIKRTLEKEKNIMELPRSLFIIFYSLHIIENSTQMELENLIQMFYDILRSRQ